MPFPLIHTIAAVNFRAEHKKDPSLIPEKLKECIPVSAVKSIAATENPNVVFINSEIYALYSHVSEYFALQW